MNTYRTQVYPIRNLEKYFKYFFFFFITIDEQIINYIIPNTIKRIKMIYFRVILYNY